MIHAKLAAAGAQIIGDRAEQQDRFALASAFLADGEEAPLFVVADGMGGHRGGAIAAELAVEAFLDAAELQVHQTYPEVLAAALASANRAIGEGVRENPELKGMGCTLIAAIPQGTSLHFISVGDSLLVRLRETGLERVNEDHSMAPMIDQALANGEMDEAEARDHPQRSALRSALTGSPISLVNSESVDFLPQQWFIIASDGLLSLDPPRIAEIVLAQGPAGAEAVASGLLDAVQAEQEPAQDNCTVVSFQNTDRAGAQRSRQKAAGRPVALLMLLVGLAIIGMVWWILFFGQPVADPPPPQLAEQPIETPAGSTNQRIPGFARDEARRTPAQSTTARDAPAARPKSRNRTADRQSSVQAEAQGSPAQARPTPDEMPAKASPADAKSASVSDEDAAAATSPDPDQSQMIGPPS